MSETPDQLPAELSDRLGFLLGRAHLALGAVVGPAIAPFGLGVKEYGALSILIEEGPLSQQRLGERQGVDRTTTVAVVDALERAGLVERRRNPGDRRAYALHPTPKGRWVLERARTASEQAENQFLAGIPAADRRRLKELLRRLIAPSPQR